MLLPNCVSFAYFYPYYFFSLLFLVTRNKKNFKHSLLVLLNYGRPWTWRLHSWLLFCLMSSQQSDGPEAQLWASFLFLLAGFGCTITLPLQPSSRHWTLIQQLYYKDTRGNAVFSACERHWLLSFFCWFRRLKVINWKTDAVPKHVVCSASLPEKVWRMETKQMRNYK